MELNLAPWIKKKVQNEKKIGSHGFLKDVSRSKKGWTRRQNGVKTLQGQFIFRDWSDWTRHTGKRAKRQGWV